MSIFSDRLRWLREKSGMNQREMADKLGVSQQVYSNFELGKREPNIETLSKLPPILGYSLDFILKVTDVDDQMIDLYNRYFFRRNHYEDLMKRLESIDEILDQLDDRRIEAKLNLLVRTKESIPLAKIDAENAYNKLIEYVKTIPHVDEYYLTDEAWDEYYNIFLQQKHVPRQDLKI